MTPPDRRPVATRQATAAKRVAATLTRWGATPNSISFASMGFALLAGIAFALVPSSEGVFVPLLFVAAIAGMQGRLLCNLFDGMVAIEGGQATATGEIWNDLPDRVSDTLILVGAGYAFERYELGWLAAAGALFVAYIRVLGRASGAKSHFLGPMAKQHRMALLTAGAATAAGAALVHPGWVEWVLQPVFVVLLVGEAVTAVRRLRAVAADLNEANP